MNGNSIKLGERRIGLKHPCYIIAEAGVNHNGSIDVALELVREAKRVGADCIKFQTFKAEEVVTKSAPKANYQLDVTDRDESQLKMLEKLELNYTHYERIISLCKSLNIQFLSTPYNNNDVDFLNKLGVDGFKIASGQIIEHLFIEYVARYNKPIILSTGMANFEEVSKAVEIIRNTGNENIVVLQCTTNYPSSIKDANINAMDSMKNNLNILVGYSDHVSSNYACYAAVAKGACIVEKHFTLDKKMEGPDHSSSLNPSEFKELVHGIKSVENSLGSSIKSPSKSELLNITGMRRSIVANKTIREGSIINSDDLVFKRPATGISPSEVYKIIGKKTKKKILKDSIIAMTDLT